MKKAFRCSVSDSIREKRVDDDPPPRPKTKERERRRAYGLDVGVVRALEKGI